MRPIYYTDTDHLFLNFQDFLVRSMPYRSLVTLDFDILTIKRNVIIKVISDNMRVYMIMMYDTVLV